MGEPLAQLPLLILASSPRPALPEESRKLEAGQDPPSMQNVNCESVPVGYRNASVVIQR